MQVFESGNVQDMCGEDVSFCLDAKEKDFEIWCDPRIRVGHERLGLSDITDYMESSVPPLVSRIKLKYYGNDERGNYIPGKPKKTRQGSGKNTYAPATSRNKAKKPYRGQGR